MNKAFEKILEMLEREIAGKPTPDEYNNGINRAYSIVQEVSEEFATDTNVGTNGWIPCSERLPEEEADVLLSLRSFDVYTGFRANAEGCFYIDGDGYVTFFTQKNAKNESCNIGFCSIKEILIDKIRISF